MGDKAILQAMKTNEGDTNRERDPVAAAATVARLCQAIDVSARRRNPAAKLM
jgi:hypothetical protein